MIYGGLSVACLKLIIGNARVVLQLVQDTLSLALQIPGKLGWPATSRFLWFLMLMSLLFLVWQGPCHKPALEQTKRRRGENIPSAPVFCFFLKEQITPMLRYFYPHGEVCCHKEQKGMRSRIRYFKSNCFQVLCFSRNYKPHSVLWAGRCSELLQQLNGSSFTLPTELFHGG